MTETLESPPSSMHHRQIALRSLHYRSAMSLDSTHHNAQVISRAAVLEFKLGAAERARVLMEGVLRNYPKRVDLWSVYLDQVSGRGRRKWVSGPLYEYSDVLVLSAV